MNIENLTKLADYLDTVDPEKFNMVEFQSECGTVACAAGHLPAATGIEKLPLEFWGDYIERVTELNDYGRRYQWSWCFSGDWFRWDNTPQGAADRIRYMLKNGTPENWCYSEETVGLYQ